jgi:tRNA 2-thiouridine synthesizing protein A
MDIGMMAFDHELDASGLNCPLPLLRLKKALSAMQSGEVVRMLATDPTAYLDIGVYAEQTGHQILGHCEQEGIQTFFVRKK